MSTPVTAPKWKQAINAMSMKSFLRHKFGSESRSDCSDEFHDFNQGLKSTRSGLEHLRQSCLEFSKASEIYSKQLKSFGDVLSEVTHEHVQVVGEDIGSVITHSFSQIVAGFENSVQCLTTSLMQPLDGPLAQQFLHAKETKQRCYEALQERNSLSNRINQLVGTNKMSASKLSELQGQHRIAAEKFAELQRTTVQMMAQAEKNVSKLCLQVGLATAQQQQKQANVMLEAATAMQRILARAKVEGDSSHGFNEIISGSGVTNNATSSDELVQQWVQVQHDTSFQTPENASFSIDVQQDNSHVIVGTSFEGALSTAYVDDDLPLMWRRSTKPHTLMPDFSKMTNGLLPPLLPASLVGERVVLIIPRVFEQSTVQFGTVLASNYRLRFCPYRKSSKRSTEILDSSETEISVPSDLSPLDASQCVSIPLRSIAQMEVQRSKQPESSSLVVWCQNLSSIVFNFFHTEQRSRSDTTTLENTKKDFHGIFTDHVTTSAPHVAVGSKNVAERLSKAISSNVWTDAPTFALSYHLPSTDDELATLRYFARTAFTQLSTDEQKKLFVQRVALSQSQSSKKLTSEVLDVVSNSDGWNMFSWDNELARMKHGTKFWRVCRANHDYSLAPTYPAAVFAPQSVEDRLITAAAKYRSKCRFPAVVWVYNEICIARASQPMSGMFGTHSNADETLLGAFRSPGLPSSDEKEDSSTNNGSSDGIRLRMYDARPRVNAVSNRTKGGGSESINRYADSSLDFLGIDNIHVVRDAFFKLRASLWSAASAELHGRAKQGAAISDYGSKRRKSTISHGTDDLASDNGTSSSTYKDMGSSSNISHDKATNQTSLNTINHTSTGLPTEHPVLSSASRAELEADNEACVQSRRLRVLRVASRSPISSVGHSDADMKFGLTSPTDETSGSAAKSPIVQTSTNVNVSSNILPTSDNSMYKDVPDQPLSDVSCANFNSSQDHKNISTPRSETPHTCNSEMNDLQTLPSIEHGYDDTSIDHETESMKDTAILPSPENHITSHINQTHSNESVLHLAAIAREMDFAKVEWMRLLSILLKGACSMAKDICKGVSVFVHCSDGWDRTAQLSSLVQIIMDPYYRTVAGFCILIDKEWCSFGHQFSRRFGTGCGHPRKNHAEKQRSPVFLQFLDAVWQIYVQYPTAFEFNERLLVLLAEHVHSGRFGTFLYDNPRLRELSKLPDRSQSIWSFVARYAHVYRNEGYKLPDLANSSIYYSSLALSIPDDLFLDQTINQDSPTASSHTSRQSFERDNKTLQQSHDQSNKDMDINEQHDSTDADINTSKTANHEIDHQTQISSTCPNNDQNANSSNQDELDTSTDQQTTQDTSTDQQTTQDTSTDQQTTQDTKTNSNTESKKSMDEQKPQTEQLTSNDLARPASFVLSTVLNGSACISGAPEAAFWAGALATRHVMQNSNTPDEFVIMPENDGDICSLRLWHYWIRRWVC